MVDPHVHLRDWNQREKETLAHGFSVAWRAGISAVFEMPNTAPPLTTSQALVRRQEEADLARSELGLPILHGMFAGLTADEAQVEEMVRAYREMYPRVVGFKLYAGHSTGRMGVTDTGDQLRVWRILARAGFRGVVALHGEREDLFKAEAWDPTKPETHNTVRPPLAEIAAVQTQLDLAEAAGFRAHLHVCHVSVADTVTLVRSEEGGLPFTVSLGVTPHHLLLNSRSARASTFPEWNVNPPLREESNRRALWAALIRGDIDWIESDHAPHTLADKRRGESGLPGLGGYRLLVETLLAGLESANESSEHMTALTSNAVHGLTVARACEVFRYDIGKLPNNPHSPFEPDGAVRRPRPSFDYGEIACEYPLDPYRQDCLSDTLPRIHHG